MSICQDWRNKADHPKPIPMGGSKTSRPMLMAGYRVKVGRQMLEIVPVSCPQGVAGNCSCR